MSSRCPQVRSTLWAHDQARHELRVPGRQAIGTLIVHGDSTQVCTELSAKKPSWAHTEGGGESMVPLCSEVSKEKEWTVGGTTQLPSSTLLPCCKAEKARVKRRERGSVPHRKRTISLDWPWPQESTGQPGMFLAIRSESLSEAT